MSTSRGVVKHGGEGESTTARNLDHDFSNTMDASSRTSARKADVAGSGGHNTSESDDDDSSSDDGGPPPAQVHIDPQDRRPVFRMAVHASTTNSKTRV